MVSERFPDTSGRQWLAKLRELTFGSTGAQELEHFGEVTAPDTATQIGALEYAKGLYMEDERGYAVPSERGKDHFEYIYLDEGEDMWKFEAHDINTQNAYDALTHIIMLEETLMRGDKPPSSIIEDGTLLIRLAGYHRKQAENLMTEQEERWGKEGSYESDEQRTTFKSRHKSDEVIFSDNLDEYGGESATLQSAQRHYKNSMAEAEMIEKLGQFAVEIGRGMGPASDRHRGRGYL